MFSLVTNTQKYTDLVVNLKEHGLEYQQIVVSLNKY